MSGEAAFIERLRALAHHPAARGLADDAAVLEVGDEAIVLTHDMLVEGVHFLPGADWADVAWKLVATNLSDLAAKGAEPLGVLLGFMLGEGRERFAEGLAEVLEHYGVPLLGGDTVHGGPPRSFGLTALGRATHRPVPARSGAQAGDLLWLTGEVGAAMAGFEALRDGTAAGSPARLEQRGPGWRAQPVDPPRGKPPRKWSQICGDPLVPLSPNPAAGMRRRFRIRPGRSRCPRDGGRSGRACGSAAGSPAGCAN